MQKQENGLLIVFEGIDGSGKTTLSYKLYKYLLSLNYSAFLTKEPGGTDLGKALRSLVIGNSYNSYTEFLLFAADRAEHFSEIIIPKLNSNDIVISDRLNDSSLAYQGFAKGVKHDFIKNTNEVIMRNRQPDLVFYIDVDYKVAQKRIKQRVNSFNVKPNIFDKEKESFFEKVKEGFKEIYVNKKCDKKQVVTLDGDLSIPALCNIINDYVDKYLNSYCFNKLNN